MILRDENGLQASVNSFDESDTCAVCLERACSVAAEGIFKTFAALFLS